LSVICFIYQSIELTLEFTEFKTKIYVELFKVENSIRKMTSYSYCTSKPNTDSIDLLKITLNSSNNNDSKRSKAAFPQIIHGLNIKERNISKYLILAKNQMISNLRCLKYGENEVFIEKNPIIIIIITIILYFSKLFQDFNSFLLSDQISWTLS
jgi:hypothetical protein